MRLSSCLFGPTVGGIEQHDLAEVFEISSRCLHIITGCSYYFLAVWLMAWRVASMLFR
jgi:hypothetical protein